MSSLNPIPRSTRRQDLVASLGQTQFQPNNFTVYDPLDVRVRVKAAGSTRFFTRTAGFSVALTGAAPAYPVVTFTPGLAAGDTVRIEGARIPERVTDVTFGGSIRSTPLETELDKTVLFGQEVRRDFDDIADKLEIVDLAAEAAATSAALAGTSAATAVGAAAIASGLANAFAIFESRAQAIAATIPAPIPFVRLAGYSAAGDGGASLYKRIATPVPVKAWHFQSAGGAYWELAEPAPNAHMFGAKADNLTDPTAAFQAMVDYLASKGGGEGLILPGTYAQPGSVLLNGAQGVSIRGSGMNTTTIRATSAANHIFSKTSNVLAFDIEISDITFELNNVNTVGIYATYVERFALRRCRMRGGHVWGILVGINDGTQSAIVNRKITIEDCIFSQFSVTYEHVLLFNSEDILVQNCHFETTPNGIAVGIYQWVDRVTIRDCDFLDCDRGIYYAVTTNNILIDGCTFRGGLLGIQGANISDHGLFGQSLVYGLKITKCYFTGMSTAVELGAVRNAVMSGCTVEYCKQMGVHIFDGNLPIAPFTAYVTISDCVFRSNNTSGVSHSIHAGLLIGNALGNLHLSNLMFYDDQATKTQYYPISFAGGASNTVTAVACDLFAYGTGASIGLFGGATVTGGKLVASPVSAVPAGFTSV